ncbi:hypothetical protein [uncultured Pseudokineococcus sp.]|uniref:hypothetical protein n=1 Tax=uncultured Pseudokineococcus sp. TaxID=1642928 RepID=UPI00261D2B79|nr:hypothetical protein [uncultured Pseudokineococcus sp.]
MLEAPSPDRQRPAPRPAPEDPRSAGTDPLHPVWTPGGTPLGVLRAMTAEGLLVELLPQVWVAADLAHETGARAAALGVLLRRAAGPDAVSAPVVLRAVVGLAAAAWLHGCPLVPARVDLLVPCGTGSRGLPAPLRLRRVADPGAGAVRLGALRASDRARTLADLRGLGRGRREADALRWLEQRSGTVPDAGGPRQAPTGSSGAVSPRRPVER